MPPWRTIPARELNQKAPTCSDKTKKSVQKNSARQAWFVTYYVTNHLVGLKFRKGAIDRWQTKFAGVPRRGAYPDFANWDDETDFFEGSGCASDWGGESDFPKGRVVATNPLSEGKFKC